MQTTQATALREESVMLPGAQRFSAEVMEMARVPEPPPKQQLVYNSRPFVLCGLPVKRPATGILLHERRNGKFTLQVTGHPNYGLPFGQDRLIPIWVATLALRQRDRFIHFKSAAEILHTFGLPKDGRTYRRLVEGFQRIFGATIFFGTDSEKRITSMHDYARFHFFDRMRVWYTRHLDEQQLPGEDFQNQILLSENFWKELKRHPIPINLEAVRALANAPAELDFYCWLVWRSWTARKQIRIPLIGEGGLIRQLGISKNTGGREFRRQLKRWLSHIKTSEVWLDCPASLDGDYLIVQHKKAVAERSTLSVLT
jgi:hypothetical protein